MSSWLESSRPWPRSEDLIPRPQSSRPRQQAPIQNTTTFLINNWWLIIIIYSISPCLYRYTTITIWQVTVHMCALWQSLGKSCIRRKVIEKHIFWPHFQESWRQMKKNQVIRTCPYRQFTINLEYVCFQTTIALIQVQHIFIEFIYSFLWNDSMESLSRFKYLRGYYSI